MIRTIELNGEWDFFYSPQGFVPGETPLPKPEVFTGRMVTPGYWDDHWELYCEEDFFGLTARFNPDYRPVVFPMARSLTPHAASSFLIGTGFYRRSVAFEAAVDLAVLQVGPAMWGCSVFCNGELCGVQTGYSTATDFDLTPHLRRDSANEIVIAVCNRHDDGGAYCRLDGTHAGMDFGTRPGQHRGLAAQGFQSERGGICGGVKLKLADRARIADWFVSFENEVPHWHAELVHGKNRQLRWRIGREEGEVCSGVVACDSDAADFFTPEFSGRRWSDHDPALYDLELALCDEKGECDKATRRWGAVKATVDGMTIRVNGLPTCFRGVTEHCYFPETTNPHSDLDKYRHDLGVLKAAGFNFIRCHTWCPPDEFYTACDELGIMVQTELPSVYTFAEAEAVIRQIRRHPCAVIFCEGNEKLLDEAVIARIRKLAALLRQLAPGLLFDPQEAMRGVECPPFDGPVREKPFPHDPVKLAELREFSDVFGAHAQGYCSYGHSLFPSVEEMRGFFSIYQRPCLVHEAGIMGGYLDFSLEKRYEGTYIGTAIFRAARDNMRRHGVWENAEKYYRLNTQMVSSMRKQLFENMRSCDFLAGFDFLGGIDTHWHLNGYPCGVFNEFYEEKYGETVADIRRYNGETILICGAGKWRNRKAGSRFAEDILVSHFGAKPLERGVLRWEAKDASGAPLASGSAEILPVAVGGVRPIGRVEFDIPDAARAGRFVLSATLESGGGTWDNLWDFWTYPTPPETAEYPGVRELPALTPADVEDLKKGGRILLTGGFPGETFTEAYQSCSTGRSIGHCGTVIHAHPVWDEFPHAEYAQWNFFPLMADSTSLVTDAKMPEYTPILELIPPFKLIRRKSLLCEYRVGSGRLLVCGLRLDAQDPAAPWMRHVLMKYLGGGELAPAPRWDPDALLLRLAEGPKRGNTGLKIDSGGRPIFEN